MSAIPCASVSLKTMADGTLRISFDIEPMHAQDAFRLFATPGTPAAVAALQVGYAAASDDVHAMLAKDPTNLLSENKPKGGPLSKLAGMWCATKDFQDWINDNTHGGIYWQCNGPLEAKLFVCEICDIDSRAELDHDTRAKELFNNLIRDPYSKRLLSLGATA